MGYPKQIPSKETWLLEDGTTLNSVHNRADCAANPEDYSIAEGTGCAFHRPSDHPLNEAKLIWQNGRLWRICEHDIAHPDYDALVWGRTQGYKDPPHLCCSNFCCSIVMHQDRVATHSSEAPTARRRRRRIQPPPEAITLEDPDAALWAMIDGDQPHEGWDDE